MTSVWNIDLLTFKVAPSDADRRIMSLTDAKGSRTQASPAEDCCELGFLNWLRAGLTSTGVQDRPVSAWRGLLNQERWPHAHQTRTLIQSVRILD